VLFRKEKKIKKGKEGGHLGRPEKKKRKKRNNCFVIGGREKNTRGLAKKKKEKRHVGCPVGDTGGGKKKGGHRAKKGKSVRDKKNVINRVLTKGRRFHLQPRKRKDIEGVTITCRRHYKKKKKEPQRCPSRKEDGSPAG